MLTATVIGCHVKYSSFNPFNRNQEPDIHTIRFHFCFYHKYSLNRDTVFSTRDALSIAKLNVGTGREERAREIVRERERKCKNYRENKRKRERENEIWINYAVAI